MGKSPDDRITKDVGREICERQGIKALLSGSIASLGSHYIITLEALNARTGDPIAREHIEAESKEKVLSSLGMAASNLRQKLGESLSSIKKYDVAIDQATTSSLEALKAFSMGNDARGSGRPRESLTFYQKAVELDPNFAMAYARIAVFYGNQTQIELAKEYVQKAYALRERVSEREKLYIEEKYHNYVTGDLDKAIEVLQAWASQYPNDYIPHNNLALNYRLIGRNEDSLKEAIKAVELSPTNVSARDNLIASFASLGRFDEAAAANEELARINPDNASVYFSRYALAFHRGDQAGMSAFVNHFKGKPEEPDVLTALADSAAYFGKIKEAESLTLRGRDMYKSQQRTENAGQILMSLAEKQAVIGRCQEAKRNVSAALALDRGQFTLAGAGLASAQCDDATQAQSLIDQILKLYPENMPLTRLVIPIIKANLELRHGNSAAAIQILEPLRSYEVGFISGVNTLYLRGECYLQQRLGKEAAAEFEKILNNPGVDDFAMQHVLAHLGLARAAVLMNDEAKARKEYQDFLALWKSADQDLPPLMQAKKEYAELIKGS